MTFLMFSNKGSHILKKPVVRVNTCGHLLQTSIALEIWEEIL